MTESAEEKLPLGEAWRLSDAELVAAVQEAEAVERRARARYLQLLREVDARGVGLTFGYSSLGAFVSGVSARSRGQADKTAKQVRSVTELPVAGVAVLDGSISVEHLEAIAGFRKSLSEAVLVQLSQTLDPSGVRRFADAEVRPRIDPDGVRPDEKDLADPGNRLSLRTRANGWVEYHGLLEPESGALLSSQIGAMSAPTSPPEGARPGIPPRRCHGRVGRTRSLRRPAEGGERPQLVVTIWLEERTETTHQRHLPPM